MTKVFVEQPLASPGPAKYEARKFATLLPPNKKEHLDRLLPHLCFLPFPDIFWLFPLSCNVRVTDTIQESFSKHRPSGPMLSISRDVRLSVRLFVCSLLRYSLNVFLPPIPKVGCPIFLNIRNPWGKVMERSGLRLEHFCLEVVLNHQTKKSFFWLILPYKTRWKPRFPMD